MEETREEKSKFLSIFFSVYWIPLIYLKQQRCVSRYYWLHFYIGIPDEKDFYDWPPFDIICFASINLHSLSIYIPIYLSIYLFSVPELDEQLGSVSLRELALLRPRGRSHHIPGQPLLSFIFLYLYYHNYQWRKTEWGGRGKVIPNRGKEKGTIDP